MAVSRSAVEPLFQRSSVVGKAGDLAKWVADYRAKQVFATDSHGIGDDVVRVSLTRGDKNLTLERGGSSGWKFVNPAGWGDADLLGDVGATGTFTGVNRLLGTLTNMQAASGADFVENPSAEDLAKYGVNDNSPGVVKVELKNKDGETTTAFIGKKDMDPKAAPPPRPGMPETGKWWVRVVGQQGVIRATAGDLGGLAAVIENPDPLRDRTLLSLDRARIDGIDLANGATRLRKTGNQFAQWRLYGKPEYGDPQPAAGVDRVLDVLLERRTVKSFPAPNPANFAPAELKATVKIWVDGFEPASTDPKADAKVDPRAEPKEKGKPVILEIGKVEADGMTHVRRTLADGSQAYFVVPKNVTLLPKGENVELLATANSNRLKLLDLSLKGFASTMASRLTVSGTTNYEVERQDAIDLSVRLPKWQFAKPDARKGQQADATTVDDILMALANTHSATALVDEGPDAAKLASYGLGPVPGRAPMPADPPAPRLRVVVALRDGTDLGDTKREYEFGDPVPGDAKLVYARQVGRPAVFTLPKELADKFSADLRDKAIFSFDPAKVTAVEVAGWQWLGVRTELKFVKKDNAWTVASPAGFNLDPAKIETFLAVLSRTRVKGFKNDRPGVADYGILDPQHSLGFKVEFADRPGILLTLGKLTDGDTAYFAWTSVIPEADAKGVITIDALPFKAYKEKPGAFSR